MKKIILGLVLVILFSGTAQAGTLFGRIINDNGKPLAKVGIIFCDKDTVMTNEFGGYRIELPDGERELKVKIKGISYVSDRIKIFSPTTKQNWKLQTKEKRLTKIK
jgi:hypothetical protein